MGRRAFRRRFRHEVLDLLFDAGRPGVEVVRDLGMSALSIYTFRDTRTASTSAWNPD
jgi:hypothetical protein